MAEVIRTAGDPYVGRISLVRVFSGTLRPDSVVHVSGHLDRLANGSIEGHVGHDDDERVGLLSSSLGDVLHPKPFAIAGDLCVVAKLTKAETTDTLSSKEVPALVEPWMFPDPLLPVAITAATKSDEDKLAGGLARLVAEDPTMRLEHNPETHQVILWTMGQAHVDVLLMRLRDRYGVNVVSEPLKVALRETFVTNAIGHGRHIKQSGGHGQYAVCNITVEPLDRGAGFEFVDRVVGGAVPRQYIPSVEKGVRAQGEGLHRGLPDGRPARHSHGREVPLGGLQRHGLPDRRGAGPEGRRLAADRDLARADRLDVGDGGRRVCRGGHDRSADAQRPGSRDRAGHLWPQHDQGRGAADRDHPLRHRPALGLARNRRIHPQLRTATSPCRPTWSRVTFLSDLWVSGRGDGSCLSLD